MTPTPVLSTENEVLVIEDLVRILHISRATINRRLASNAFPIPELKGLDNRHRWSKQAVEKFLLGQMKR